KEELLNKYERFMTLRDDVLKALEIARNDKVIGKSFNAKLTLYPNKETKAFLTSLNANLQQIFIVSQFEIKDYEEADERALEFESMKVLVEVAVGETCSRCWQVVPHIDHDELCPRCAKIVKDN
ncbi:MAG: isoleucine--tRNA ligase, partial [Bacilli bacterium]|nr:isoleucine--tRNA ligase [Bacilli bacterium]